MSVAVDREKILQTAQKHVEKRRYDKAVDELRKVVEADPQDVRTLLRIGDLHLKLEQYQDAIETYEQVGNYYYREGFSVKAIAVYKQIRGIIRRHAQHLEGRYGHIVPRLAEIYTQLGLTSDALAAYDEVATRLRREGRERDALDIFKKVVDLDPQNPIAHLRVADSRARLGDMDQAVERFGEAAEIMVGLGRTGDALKVLERLLEYRQAPVYARRAAELYLNRGQQNDGMAALKKLQVAFKSNPKDMETLKMLARAFEAIGQPKKAIDVLKESARIARDAGDHAALNELLDLLTARAPDDTLIGRLDQWRLKEAARLDEAELEVETEDLDVEELSEVFELEEDELDYGEDPAGQTLLGEGQVEVTQESAVRNLIGEAERQRLAGRLDQAIRLLRDGLRNLRGAPALRHRLSDILLEAGDQVGAISEKLVLARELAHENDIGGAVQMLDEVLLLQPDQPEAMQMRASLGHPVAGSAYDANIPLQSYDVESGGVEEALHRSQHPSVPPVATLDDPFNDASLPPARGSGFPAERISAVPASRGPLNEAALDEAETLVEQARFDEARHLLYELLRQNPEHPLILDRIADLEAAEIHHNSPGSLPSAASGPSPVSVGPPASGPAPDSAGYAPSPGSGYGDSAAVSLSHTSQSGNFPVGESPESASIVDQYSVYDGMPPSQKHAAHNQWTEEVDSLLGAVREVKSDVAESDAATHYDLGVAYHEMGLHNDAVSELTLAARDPKREVVCLATIGNIKLSLGDYDAALDALHRALQSPNRTAQQEVAIGYEIANTYEFLNMAKEALYYFEWLAQVDPSYQDPRGPVGERIHQLRTESGAQPRPGVAPPDGAEMQNAFDDVFEEG